VRSASTRFLEAVTSSYVLSTTVTLLDGDVDASDPLDVVDGTATFDRGAAVRGRVDLRVADSDLFPALGEVRPLSPYGYEARVERGVVYADGTVETVGLGVFVLQTATLDDGGLVSVTGLDRAQRVVDARFTDSFYVPAGETYEDAIRAVIEGQFLDSSTYAGDGVDGLSFDFIETGFVTPALSFDGQQDRWESAQKMARDVGCEVYFGGLGECRLRLIPSPTDPIVVELTEGEGGVVVSGGGRVDLDRAATYNAVVATGENTSNGAVYRAMVVDDDPTSPTYWDGRFGHKPRFYSSPFIGSDAQAAAAAAGILRDELGLSRRLSIAVVPNPVIEPSDVVSTSVDRLRVADEIHIIETQTVGLRASGGMTMATRVRQVAA
jgi:hypothetical protein